MTVWFSPSDGMEVNNMRLTTTEIFTYLIGGGILVILVIALIAIIFRKRPPHDGEE